MKQPNNAKFTALYERLSKDDEQKNESVSIAHQKQMLEDYARKNGFQNLRHFTDDGVTGQYRNNLVNMKYQKEKVKNGKGLSSMIYKRAIKSVSTLINL